MIRKIAPILCFILLFAATLFIFPARMTAGQETTGQRYEMSLSWQGKEQIACGNVLSEFFV